jgi:THO complex subunit 4
MLYIVPNFFCRQPKGQPKAQPKSAAADKQKASAAKGGAKAVGKGQRRTRSARPAKKTAEELDSEMADYFVASGNNENAGAAAPAAAAAAPAAGNGDAMEDEIMVRTDRTFKNLSIMS